MRVLRWTAGLVAAILLVGLVIVGPELHKAASEDPLVWESDVLALEQRAADAPPNAILFVGSSSIRMWDDLVADMAPIPVLQMGFGGGKIGDLRHYLNRLVLDHEPRAVVIYIGGNDLTGFLTSRSKEPAEVLAVFDEIVARIRTETPAVPVYYVAIKPTTTGRATWDKAAAVNHGVAERAAADPMVRFIDANAAVTLPDGTADPAMLKWDGIHLNRAGYVAWGAPIRERLGRDGLGTGRSDLRGGVSPRRPG